MRLTNKTDTNDYYIPVKKGMLMAGYVDKLGEYEDIDESPKHLAEVKQVLEIIKEKPQATLWYIQTFSNEMEYEYMPSFFKEDITKEQFNLLKEVLKI